MKEWKKELVRVVRVITTDNIFGRTSLPLCAGQRARLSVAGLLDANKNTRFPHKFYSGKSFIEVNTPSDSSRVVYVCVFSLSIFKQCLMGQGVWMHTLMGTLFHFGK